MSKVLLVAEHDGSTLNPSTAKTVQCAQSLNADSIDIAVFGQGIDAIAAQAAKLNGVARVLTCADLVVGDWVTNAPVNVTANDGGFGSYTNTVGTAAAQQFIKLLVD
jgi:electron transfer flavoprotein alpha subunit